MYQNVISSQTTISWILLWLSFGIASTICGIQVWYPSKGSRSNSAGSSPVTASTDVENRPSVATNVVPIRGAAASEQGSSSGDTTRQLFYKLLWVALLSRFLLLPIQIWFDYAEWWTFLAETFPEMTFASAWALLVSFFCHLVGTAAGSTGEEPQTLVMQSIAYAMYGVLMITYIWNDAAVLLLYALLCVIYAALFATLLYVGPKLLSLLKPSLMKRSGLAFRLVSCSLLCVLVFGARTVGSARKVLVGGFLKNNEPTWWYNYGLLELFPAIALLLMMQQQQNNGHGQQRGGGGRSNRSPSAAAGSTPSPTTTTTTTGTNNKNNSTTTTTMMRRANSSGPPASKPPPSRGETTALLKPISTTTTTATTTQQQQQQHVYGATATTTDGTT